MHDIHPCAGAAGEKVVRVYVIWGGGRGVHPRALAAVLKYAGECPRYHCLFPYTSRAVGVRQVNYCAARAEVPLRCVGGCECYGVLLRVSLNVDVVGTVPLDQRIATDGRMTDVASVDRFVVLTSYGISPNLRGRLLGL